MNALHVIEIVLGIIILGYLGYQLWKLWTYRTPKIEKREEVAEEKAADVTSEQRVAELLSSLKDRKKEEK